MRKSLVLAAALGALLAAPARGQEGAGGGGAAGAKLGWVSFQGADFEAVDDAIGFEGFLRYQVGSGIAMQGGAHYARHGVQGFDDELGLLAIYLEPRYALRVNVGARGAAPFLGVRGSYLRFENLGGEADANADGFGLGGVAGLTVPLTSAFGVELSVWYGTAASGTAKLNDAEIPNSDKSGGLLALQIGFFASTSTR